MQDSVQVAAYEGGKLRLLASKDAGREVVLALPLSRLLIKVVRVPDDQDPAVFAKPLLQSINPFPDELLTVSCELVEETPAGRIMIAAALPESAAEDIGEALDAAKLSVTRVDALAIGELRGLWSELGEGDDRRLVIMRGVDGLSVMILDGSRLVAIRALSDASEIKRELMLCLLEAEDFGGTRKLKEVIVAAPAETDGLPGLSVDDLKDFASVRELVIGADAALVGVAERSMEAETLNALPDSWGEMLAETRFKSKLIRYVAIAGGIWLLVMTVLFGVPIVYGFMTDRQKTLSREHSRQYRAVKTMREKTELVQKYSNHSRGALEIMKAVSDNLCADMTLSSWNFKREEGVRISGEADKPESVYDYKDKMAELAYVGEDAERVFKYVNLIGPSASKGGKQKFDLELGFEPKETE